MKKVFSVFLGGLAVVSAYAQAMDPFDSHVADFRLLVNKNVQADIVLTKPQIALLNQYADQNRTKIRAYQDQVARSGKDPRKISDSDPVLLKYFLELQGQVLAHLTPMQLRRLRELTLQSVGMRGMLDAAVSKRIGMTDVQLTKARKVFEKGALENQKISQAVYAKVIEPYKNTHPKTQAEEQALSDRIRKEYEAALAKRAPEIQKLAKQTKAEFDTVVTPKQLAAYKALGGKPFVRK